MIRLTLPHSDIGIIRDMFGAPMTQLLEVKKQLETEVQHLTSSFGQLKAAQAKFKSCIESVATVKPENKGT